MTWTARQAGYQPETQLVVTGSWRSTKHYVRTRHGIAARSFVPGAGLLVSVALLRRDNLHPQFQGEITMEGLTYVATDPRGVEVARTANYIDAEAALLPLRTRTRSHTEHTWPTHLVCELRAVRVKSTCPVCGHGLAAGECTRPDLHW